MKFNETKRVNLVHENRLVCMTYADRTPSPRVVQETMVPARENNSIKLASVTTGLMFSCLRIHAIFVYGEDWCRDGTKETRTVSMRT